MRTSKELWRDGRAVLRARWYLRHATHVGARVRLYGRPLVIAHGDLIVHDRVRLSSSVATLELVADEGGTLEIGERTFINSGTSLAAAERVSIGADCLIGPHCMIMDSSFHRLEPERRLEAPDISPITLGDNVWLGARVIVISGVTIGRDSVVGAGSVVTDSIPPRVFAAGVPARVVKAL